MATNSLQLPVLRPDEAKIVESILENEPLVRNGADVIRFLLEMYKSTQGNGKYAVVDISSPEMQEALAMLRKDFPGLNKPSSLIARVVDLWVMEYIISAKVKGRETGK